VRGCARGAVLVDRGTIGWLVFCVPRNGPQQARPSRLLIVTNERDHPERGMRRKCRLSCGCETDTELVLSSELAPHAAGRRYPSGLDSPAHGFPDGESEGESRDRTTFYECLARQTVCR